MLFRSQVEGVSEHHIGGLSSHAGQLVQLLHGSRNPTLVIFDQAGGATADRLGFGAEKAGGAYQVLQFGRGDVGEFHSRAAALEKGRGHFVNPFIGALGGKNRRHKKLKGVGVIQFTVGVRVGLLEFGNDPASPLEIGRAHV